MTPSPTLSDGKLAYTVDQAAEAIGVSRRTIYNLMNAGTLPSRKETGRRLIPAGPLKALVG